jgi:hypothetical protein
MRSKAVSKRQQKPQSDGAVTLKTKPGESPEEADARFVVEGLGHNAVVTWEFSKHLHSTLDVGEMLIALERSCEAVSGGELRPSEKLLASQAVALNAIFTRFSWLSHINLTKKSGPNLDAVERLLRLALRAQGQCRATLETLALIKNPPIFARQANIANGPQQVNNAAVVPIGDGSRVRAGSLGSWPIEQLEAANDVERVDAGATSAAVESDSRMAALAVVNRPKDR